jgi:hypothetical protein
MTSIKQLTKYFIPWKMFISVHKEIVGTHTLVHPKVLVYLCVCMYFKDNQEMAIAYELALK